MIICRRVNVTSSNRKRIGVTALVIATLVAVSSRTAIAQPSPNDAPPSVASPGDAPPPPSPPLPNPPPAVETPAVVEPPPAPELVAPVGHDELPVLAPTSLHVPDIQIHGFASEGGFVSTANNYAGNSAQGSLEFFETGINFSSEIADRLRVGIQIYARDTGYFHDLNGRIDWAYLDYHWKSWLGIRAGVIKLPYGLYNEYADADSSRLSILMPQSVYPLADRSALVAQTGFDLYGTRSLGRAGEIDYQAYLGTLNVPNDAISVADATLESVSVNYVLGAQLFWHPIDGLRIGASYARASIDYDLLLDGKLVSELGSIGMLPANFDDHLHVYEDPGTLTIGSAEYIHNDWLFAAEYSRWRTHDTTSLPMMVPATDADNERFYVMATHRFSQYVETGGYYSVYEVDAHDRFGNNANEFPVKSNAFQRDLAATVRFDINDHWLWKIEAHFMDGTADLDVVDNPQPQRYWGMFLFKTTVTF